MNLVNQRFFQELDKEIGHHPDKQNIMADYELHVYELLQEEPVDEDHIYDEIVLRLGSPHELLKFGNKTPALHQEEHSGLLF